MLSTTNNTIIQCSGRKGKQPCLAHGELGVGRQSVPFVEFGIKNERSSMTVSVTVLYTMFHLFCGVVLPLADSFVTQNNSESDHTYYLEIFLIVQYVTAMISIFYLQLYIYIYGKQLKNNCKKNGENNFEILSDDVTNPISPHMINPLNSVYFSQNVTNNEEQTLKPLSLEMINENSNLFNHETNGDLAVPENLNQTDILITRSMSGRELSGEAGDELNVLDITTRSHMGDRRSRSCTQLRMNDFSHVTDKNIEKLSLDIKINNIPFIRDSEGINLYLRLGAVGFGFGVMVHDGFKIADQFRTQQIICHNPLWTPKQALHLTYIFIQTFFVFKYHRIIFQKQNQMVRLVLWHLVIINVCQWFKTVVYEISHELLEHKLQNLAAGYDFHNDSKRHSLFYKPGCANQLSFTVSPYLFPCAIEYSLISAAIFYKMLQKIGREYREPYWIKYKEEENKKKYSECHRSHKGLFIGLLFFMATLVGLAIFLMFRRKISTENLSVIVYQVSELILLVSSIVALAIAFCQMRVLSYRNLTEEEALDDSLLLVGLSGIFAYNLFLFISAVDYSIRDQAENLFSTIILFIFKSCAEIVQSMIQVLFVLEGSRKYCKNSSHVRLKPGRSIVTFLIITNLALWVVSIFETKRADQHQIFTQYYQKTPWSIITHTLLPLIIFFRFHSTVCLSDMWTKSYRMQVKTRMDQ